MPGLLILKGSEIASLTAGREAEIIDVVAKAYQAHGRGESSLPHSSFLHWPGDPLSRVIALPAFLGAEFGIAGIKWISSFPRNLQLGLERASAVIVLNSAETGQPLAVMEGSLVSALRTAASAALAAKLLVNGGGLVNPGFVGCGPINFQVMRFLQAAGVRFNEALLFDLATDRAEQFASRARLLFPGLRLRIAPSDAAVLSESNVISFASTALTPYIFDMSHCRPETVILHVSLRDLAPTVILNALNVVDDVDHVCRAETSIHLAERQTGHRDFISGTLADLVEGRLSLVTRDRPVIFSPFGLGILDLAVAQLVCRVAGEQGAGIRLQGFDSAAWCGIPEPSMAISRSGSE